MGQGQMDEQLLDMTGLRDRCLQELSPRRHIVKKAAGQEMSVPFGAPVSSSDTSFPPSIT